jgi:signal transduction histidine kinase
MLIATNLFIRQSLNKQPIIKAISPNAISITINNEVNKSLSYYIPIESEEFMQALAHTNINSDTFNNILNSNIMQRVLTFSVLTSIIFGLLSIFAAIYYSKRITSPITNILKVTEDISLNNMNERINMPSKYDETSRIIALYNKALDKLQATFCDLELFNSYASHELRNSLAILSACLEQSADEAKTDRNDFSKIVKKALEYINRLSNTVIDIMSLSSRQLKDCNEPVDLALLAARAVDEYKLTGARI